MKILDLTRKMRLRFLFQTISGATPSSGIEKYYDGDIYWITPEDLGKLKENVIHDTRRKLSIQGYESCGTTLAPKGSLVLSKRAPIGQVAILGVEAACNQGCFLLTKKNALDERFYYYSLVHLLPDLQSLGRGSTFLELSTDDLRSIRLPNPILGQQQYIADYIDRETSHIDALVLEKERMLSLLEEKRAALISHAVTRGLDPSVPLKPSGLQWLGDIPAHWDIKPLKAVATYTVSNVDKIASEDEIPVRLANYSDIYNNEFISPEMDLMRTTATASEIAKFHLQDEDVIITKDSESWDDIGIPALVNKSADDILCGYHLAILRPKKDLIIGRFLFRCLQSKEIRLFLELASTGVTRFGLPKGEIGRLPLPIPPVSEQEFIVSEISHQIEYLKDVSSTVYKSISLLKERRSALISAAVTGQIEPEVNL